MVLNKIHIENFRAYKNFDCEFAEGVNLVIGDNGAGKTSLLTAIAQLLAVQTGALGGSVSLDPIDPHREIKKAGDTTLSIKECFPVRITGEIMNEKRERFDFGSLRTDYHKTRYQGFSEVLKKLTEQEESIWPLISYQRFDRDWKLGKNTGNTVSVEIGLNERRDGYRDCLNGFGQEERIQRWCLKMAMLEFERKKSIREFDRFKAIVQSFLQVIEDENEVFEVAYSTEASGLVLKKGDVAEPLYELSTGYKALLSMIMELAYRTVLLNPGPEADYNNQTGIVVIDEIDAHLHPKWQWRVIEALRKCFPKIQFIIATHSPIVISSAKGARLINLEERGLVSYSNEAYGYNVADVLDLKQGSVSVPRVSAVLMERMEKALNNGDLAAADQVVSEAEKEFGPASPVYTELKDYLEMNRWAEAD